MARYLRQRIFMGRRLYQLVGVLAERVQIHARAYTLYVIAHRMRSVVRDIKVFDLAQPCTLAFRL